jgi:hypothetical protein
MRLGKWTRSLTLVTLGVILVSACGEAYGVEGTATARPTESTQDSEKLRPSPIPLLELDEEPLPSATPPPSPTPIAPTETARPSPTPSVPPPTPTPTRPSATRLPERVERVPSIVLPLDTGNAPAELLEEAVADLAKRLDVDESEIIPLSDTAVTWSDGALGCPKPGELYIQVPIEGYRIILGHEGRLYDYHASDKASFLCENRSLGESSGMGELAPQLELLSLAMLDLSERLDLEMQEIVPESLEPQLWSDTSLGCPQSGYIYAQVVTEGFLVQLRVDDEVHEYHTDREQVVYCEP